MLLAKDTIYTQRIKGKEGLTIKRVAHSVSWALCLPLLFLCNDDQPM